MPREADQDAVRIMVVGGGTAGWSAAAYLSRRPGFAVTLIESSNIKTIGVGESTIPSIVDFFRSCGISESALFENCSAVRKYGIQHHGWTKRSDPWQHWFAFEGDDVTDSVRAMTHDMAGPPGRYAYHLDATRLPDVIRANNPQVTHVIDDVVAVDVDEQGVRSVKGNLATYEADFFIDCSGSRAVLRSRFPTVYKQHRNLINNYAVAGPSALTTAEPLRVTQTFAMDFGWRWKVDLQHRSGNGYAFNKDLCSVDQAVDEFIRRSGVDPAKVFEVAISNNYLTTPWHKNVLAVGMSCGFLEPLEATGLFLNYYAVEMFDRLHRDPRGQDKFNRMWCNTYTGIAAFLELFFTTSDLDHTAYWRNFPKIHKVRFRPNNLFKKYPSWTGLVQHRGLEFVT